MTAIPCTEPSRLTAPPEVDLEIGRAIFRGPRPYTLTRDTVDPDGFQAHTLAIRTLVTAFFSAATLQHRSVLDLGGDAGLFGFWAAQRGADRVDYVDSDDRYAELVGRAAHHLNISNVQARKGSLATWDRPTDVVLALGLAEPPPDASGRDSLDAVVDQLASLTRYLLIVEWVAADDPDLAPSARGGPRDEAAFVTALRAAFRRALRLGEVCPTRRLYAAFKTAREIPLSGPLPLVRPATTAVSSRHLASMDGLEYWSRVYIDRERKRVVKQTSLDLAAREYAFLRRLDSDYFPRALSLERDAAQSIVELELVDGTPLEASREAITATFERTVTTFLHLLAILDELRAAGIDHRDVNPENLLVRRGKPVLIDFGWAVSDDALLLAPAVLNPSGTPPDGRPCDAYAMGRVMDWLNRSRYPALDVVIDLMANDDPRRRVTDPRILARLVRAVVDERGGAAR